MSPQIPPRRLLRIEARNARTPIDHDRPAWLKTRLSVGPEYQDMHERMVTGKLHTVCQEAGCPNIFECWEEREATFLIGGDRCTRRCDFCQIESARPQGYDRSEPLRVARSVHQMGLRYSTVTSVCRDDLPDEGAWLCAETIRQIHALNPGVGVEMLAQDFSGRAELLDEVFEARPEVFGHNVETVPRLFHEIRPGFSYQGSLDVLRMAHQAGLIAKSNLILGMGETDEEIEQALREIRATGAELVTITQYLRPNSFLRPVDRWVTPAQFVAFGKLAQQLGFLGVMSGPLVRSSYRAGQLYRQAMSGRRQPA
ncbi:lipoic acid synthetase [Propionibacterium cyclohexanicum]|uniref:Lipoyl synthase n=1 Tax=Propionibacterium cyclohexanicum TaxID=64702 RepID=A0A1H9S1R5_9ACTN|nr:lipoyl synthase [Propionibacterium cyclohexanicum]SER78884.1 lipoic acid synthetase [Propionibacterium cyclohexanicum]